MRTVRFTPEAERTLADQLDYLVVAGAAVAAQASLTRVETFLTQTLAAYPRTGRHIVERDFWETWIPNTRLVAWYLFTDNELTVLALWHTAQDRR